MNRNIKIMLRYDGTKYDGWQKQGNTNRTIQGKLENILERMTGCQIEVHGSGRTDAGVHALGQVANFALPESFYKEDSTNELVAERVKKYLNEYLPEDIAVIEAKEVSPRFHSRLNAISKTYLYRIETSDKKDVFERKYIYGLGRSLDIDAMKEAASYLIGTHDFKSFCSVKRMKKSTVRTITEIIIKEEQSKVLFTFKGNGFLYNMVRIMTGTLIEAGLHERTAESVKEALEGCERRLAGVTAPPEGLFLKEVSY